jgi:pimeloyl-ACP methyl ester carboxylesterase
VGLGRSDRPPTGGLDLEAQAEHLRALMDALGIPAAVLVAHDVGGGVAQIFAQRHPERLRGLVLVDVVAFARYWPVTMIAALRLPLVGELGSIAPQGPVLRAAIAKGLHHPEALTDGVFWRYHEPLAGERGRFRFLDFVRALDPARVEQAVLANADLPVPVRILWGEHDAYQPLTQARELQHTMKSSRLTVVPGAGHFLPEERPDAVAAAIDGLLRETGSRRL